MSHLTILLSQFVAQDLAGDSQYEVAVTYGQFKPSITNVESTFKVCSVISWRVRCNWMRRRSPCVPLSQLSPRLCLRKYPFLNFTDCSLPSSHVDLLLLYHLCAQKKRHFAQKKSGGKKKEEDPWVSGGECSLTGGGGGRGSNPPGLHQILGSTQT